MKVLYICRNNRFYVFDDILVPLQNAINNVDYFELFKQILTGCYVINA